MPEIINPETHHERSDVNVRALLWFMVIFIVFAAISHLLLWIMFKYFAEQARTTTTAPLTSVARPPEASIPQPPRLQPFPNRDRRGDVLPPKTTTPEMDMEEMRAAEEEALHKPAWIDRQKGIVRVPIDVAKQLVVQRGQR
jgi:cytoskeletal protein RodZ